MLFCGLTSSSRVTFFAARTVKPMDPVKLPPARDDGLSRPWSRDSQRPGVNLGHGNMVNAETKQQEPQTAWVNMGQLMSTIKNRVFPKSVKWQNDAKCVKLTFGVPYLELFPVIKNLFACRYQLGNTWNILQSCIQHDLYQSTSRQNGKSFNIYNSKSEF